MAKPMQYTVRRAIPSAVDYCRLREDAGLSPKTMEAAERGLPNTLFAVQVLAGDKVVGMGRIIGDGGCFYQVVDIAVLPEYQGRGLGKTIMREIAAYIEQEVPASAYISLLAYGKAYQLYQQYCACSSVPPQVSQIIGHHLQLQLGRGLQ